MTKEGEFWDDEKAFDEAFQEKQTKEVVEAEVVEEPKEEKKEKKITDIPFAKPTKPKYTKEQIERNKEILLGIGFYKKEGGSEDRVQYIAKEGQITVGRTFSKDYPEGKFWAMKDGDLPAKEKFVSATALKELEIVQAFYAVRDKGEDIEKFKPAQPPAKRTGAAPAKHEVAREIGTLTHQARGGYYSVRGHEEPDAWMVQQWGNQAGFSVSILEAEQDTKQAKVIVRAQKNGQFVDAVVIHDFETSKDVIALEVIENMERYGKEAITDYEDDGRPVLSAEAKYRIYKQYIRFKNFAIRDATTKATRIAILKLMNRDWRDPEEIAAEEAEVRSVNEK